MQMHHRNLDSRNGDKNACTKLWFSSFLSVTRLGWTMELFALKIENSKAVNKNKGQRAMDWFLLLFSIFFKGISLSRKESGSAERGCFPPAGLLESAPQAVPSCSPHSQPMSLRSSGSFFYFLAPRTLSSRGLHHLSPRFPETLFLLSVRVTLPLIPSLPIWTFPFPASKPFSVLSCLQMTFLMPHSLIFTHMGFELREIWVQVLLPEHSTHEGCGL